MDLARSGGFGQAASQAKASCAFTKADIWSHSRYHDEIQRLGQWLARQSRPLGVLGFDDNYGRFIIDAARRAGLRVPDDIAVVGVNDDDVNCEVCRPPLTSVDPNADRIGFEAGMLAEALLQGQPPPRDTVYIPPRGVIERGSTPALAVEDPDLVRAVRFIHENASQGLRVSDVVAHTSLSRRGLEAKFRRMLNRTPLEEIRHAKIQLACRYIIETDWSLARVALESGFSGPAHLSRLIKAATGLSPRDYRRSRK